MWHIITGLSTFISPNVAMLPKESRQLHLRTIEVLNSMGVSVISKQMLLAIAMLSSVKSH